MKRTARTLLLIATLLPALAAVASAYPLSGYERTGIRRLWAYDPARQLGGPSLPSGALVSLSAVQLRMLDNPDYDLSDDTPRDPELQRGLEGIFAGRDPNYSIALIDITDPLAPRYAAIDPHTEYLPGSVGKLLVSVGLFDALAEVWPDPDRRLEVLRETWATADEFVQWDSHTVPIVDMEAGTLRNRPIQVGDRFTLFEWLDHMLSPSSNAAGAFTWKQAMLVRAFGQGYPPTAEQEAAWWAATAPLERQELAVRTIVEPLQDVGLDTEAIRQGTMFTDTGKRRVPGVGSYASPFQLARLLLKIEQGKVVDEFSSLEIKRLLQFTRRRYRYASSPALNDAVVYFKSGSFYRCVDEPGFECRQYAGNDTNIMNSVAIVESPATPAPGERQRVYLTAMMSNVLRLNSAVEHQSIATFIERLVTRLHTEPKTATGA